MSGFKRKVLHVTSMHDWKDDRIFERACVGLARAGVDVHLIASPEMKGYLGNSGRKGSEEMTEIAGVKIHWLQQRQGLRRRLFSSYEAMRLAKKINPDIIHFHDPDLLPWMFLLAHRGYKVVYDIHENYVSRITRSRLPVPVSKPLGKLYRNLENFFVRQFSGSVVVTDSMKMVVQKANPNVRVVNNLPYLSQLEGVRLADEKFPVLTIYTSGTNSNARNCRQTIMAAPLIAKEVPDFRMMFVGQYPGNYEKELRILVKELGMEQYVVIEGMLPYLENFQRTSRAHIGCVFYEDNDNNRLTLPNRLFEYMYCGVAILAEDFPEVRKVVNDANCGILVNSNDPQSIANGAVKLFNDRGKIEEYANNGQRAVKEKYNFEAALEDLLNLYNEG